MSAEVFITATSRDCSAAQTVCEALENRGLSCWIGGRDSTPGDNLQASVIRAIRGPITLITLGVLFALNNFTPYGFSETWPVLLIVFGVLSLLCRGSGASAAQPPYGYPQGGYPPPPHPQDPSRQPPGENR